MENFIERRIDILQNEYNSRMESFKRDCQNESWTDCFEYNAINQLNYMLELKGKIKELNLLKMMKFK